MPIVTGLVSGKPLTAPLSGVQCVWFKVRVESWQATKDLHHRETVYFTQSAHPVVVGTTPVSAGLVDAPPSVTETVSGKRPPTGDEAPWLFRLANAGLIEPAALARRAHLLDEIVWQTTEFALLPGTIATARGKLSRGQLKPSLLTRSFFTV